MDANQFISFLSCTEHPFADNQEVAQWSVGNLNCMQLPPSEEAQDWRMFTRRSRTRADAHRSIRQSGISYGNARRSFSGR